MHLPVNPHLASSLASLRNLLMTGRSLEDAVSYLIAEQRQQFQRFPDVLSELHESVALARECLLKELNQVEYLQKGAMRFGRQLWYSGPSESATIWNCLMKRLQAQGRSPDERDLVDRESTTVVSLLDAPTKQTFSTRGLVVGHVQSGKTGNMAAVIAKAADTQFKFFLVLSGMTDQLRDQTQRRLLADVVAGAPERWCLWTTNDTADASGDFSHPAVGGFSFDNRNQLAVIKKNAAILRRVLAKLLNTDAATKAHTPFLIIDDECDQASVNSARYDAQMTAINEHIRALIKACPRVAYVGYTATPFANVLVDTRPGDDLYPRDFIHALGRPPAYFGAQELFGRAALNGEYDEHTDGFDMIRLIPDTEVGVLRPGNRRLDGFAFRLTPSLEAAIRYFVLVIAARRARGQSDAHNTMLVHTSVRTAVHRQAAGAIRPYVRRLVEELRAANRALIAQMEEQWREEQSKVLSEQFDLRPVGFTEMHPFLVEAASLIDVHVENFTSTERLDYTGGTRCYVVVGGNVLARGLTLEGLSVSYFLRSSSQYDTLMQMGRWFGYRRGFEDLPRVWVEESVKGMFYDLATVEAEVRREIARYAEEEITPAQFAVRIRKIPGMTITARAKMRHAVDVEIGYEGEHVQTFRFKRKDGTWLETNWTAGSLLGDELAWERTGKHRVARRVPVRAIVAFLDKYECHPNHKQMTRVLLSSYITQLAQSDAAAAHWNVVVVGGDGRPSTLPLGRLGHVPTVVRSAEKDSGDDASIKALMSRRDILIDVGNADAPADPDWQATKRARSRAGGPPLLLLYPIEAESRPSRSSDNRESLAAAMDVLGIGVVFPGETAAGTTYVAANLRPDDAAEEMEDGEDLIPEAAFGGTTNHGETA